VAALGDLEAVLVGVVLAVLGEHRGVLLVPHVADEFEEEERQDEGLPVGAINWAPPQDIGRIPQVRLPFTERHGLCVRALALRRSHRGMNELLGLGLQWFLGAHGLGLSATVSLSRDPRAPHRLGSLHEVAGVRLLNPS
jgi:hypothetical protein